MQQRVSVESPQNICVIKSGLTGIISLLWVVIFLKNNLVKNSSLRLLFRPLFPSHKRNQSRKRNRDFRRHSVKARQGLPDLLLPFLLEITVRIPDSLRLYWRCNRETLSHRQPMLFRRTAHRCIATRCRKVPAINRRRNSLILHVVPGDFFQAFLIFIANVITVYCFIADNQADQIGGIGQLSATGKIHWQPEAGIEQK